MRWVAQLTASISAEDATRILGDYDITGPTLLDTQPLNPTGERSLPCVRTQYPDARIAVIV
jgi:hypothetical protein